MTDSLAAAFDRMGSNGSVDPKAVAQAVSVAVDVFRGHPLLSSIRSAMSTGVVHRDALSTVDDVLAERLQLVCALLVRGHDRHDGNMVHVARSLYRALPVLWMRDMTRQAAATPVPRHVLGRDVLAQSPMWFTFDNEYSGEIADMDNIWGVLLEHTDRIASDDGASAEGLGYTWIGQKDGGPAIKSAGHRYGDYVDTQADVSEWGHGRPPTISIFGMLSFMNSPYIPKETKHLPRQQRRASERRGFDASSDAVTFVDLRPVFADHEPGGDGAQRQYHHRWIVRGHHRAQWYPSRKSHMVIWIAPHVKGPDDAPLKESVYRVIR